MNYKSYITKTAEILSTAFLTPSLNDLVAAARAEEPEATLVSHSFNSLGPKYLLTAVFGLEEMSTADILRLKHANEHVKARAKRHVLLTGIVNIACLEHREILKGIRSIVLDVTADNVHYVGMLETLALNYRDNVLGDRLSECILDVKEMTEYAARYFPEEYKKHISPLTA